MENLKLEFYKRIKEKEIELYKTEPNNENYSILLKELELIRLQFQIIDIKKDNNYDDFLRQTKPLYEKYYFLKDLHAKEIEQIIIRIKNYKKYISDAQKRDKDIFINEDLVDIKNELLLNKIDYKKIEKSTDIEKILEIIKAKKENFKKCSEEYYSVIKNFKVLNYLLLKNSDNRGLIDIEIINSFKNLGSDHIIEFILEKNKEKEIVQKQTFITNKQKNSKIEEIDKKIEYYLKELLVNVENFIKYNFNIYNKELFLNINGYNYKDLNDLSIEILDKIKAKEKSIDKVIHYFENEKSLYERIERGIKTQLTKLIPDIEENTDLINIDYNELYDIISKIKIYYLLTQGKVLIDENTYSLS